MAKKADSFRIEQEVVIAASRERVWDCLLDVAGWWAFRVGKDANALTLEPRLGGRFYERFGTGEEGVLWGTVRWLERPEVLQLEGVLGMDGPVVSVYEYRLATQGAKTVLKLTHEVFGLLDPAWKEGHTKGWAKLLGLLTAFAEGGGSRKP